MKILVCMSVVPETTTKVSFTDNNTQFNKDGVQYIINPYDELSLSRALEITEAQGGTVTVVHVGRQDAEPVIRKGLAMGATDAIRIDADPTDAQFVAEQIAKVATDGGYEVILTGRESIDYNSGMVGGLLGEMLNMPMVNVISTLDIDGDTATMVKDIDGGRQTVSCKLPFVASAQKDLTEPRIPNMRGIMAARSKPLSVVEASANNDYTSVSSFTLPESKGDVKLIDADNPGELIQLLKNEAKVL
jgi:electron transfer flavoprotein beta subunit